MDRDPPRQTGRAREAAAKAERKAEALRANLRRRKEQARSRVSEPAGPLVEDASPDEKH